LVRIIYQLSTKLEVNYQLSTINKLLIRPVSYVLTVANGESVDDIDKIWKSTNEVRVPDKPDVYNK